MNKSRFLPAEDAQEDLAPILLVEDEPNDVWLMRRAFERAQVRNPLLVAGNGDEAIEVFASGRGGNTPCLLVANIETPKVDGSGLLRWLKHRPEFDSMPKVVISSSVPQEDLAKALHLGATRYHVRPSSHTGLMQLVLNGSEPSA
jgi:CheY-like chemotaxis protein